MIKKEEMASPGKVYPAKVLALDKYEEHNFHLELSRPKGFNFKAGQFAMLHMNGDQKPFSIAAPPSQGSLTFLIKEHENGTVTPHLYDLKVGDTINISGPFGAYFIKEQGKELFFIAAGTGIAPFRSLIFDHLEKHPQAKISLLAGFRTQCYFEKEWKELEKKYKNFKLYTSCSQTSKGMKCLRGHITDHLTTIIPNARNKGVYICGPKPMVEDVKKILFEQLKFTQEQIHMEKW